MGNRRDHCLAGLVARHQSGPPRPRRPSLLGHRPIHHCVHFRPMYKPVGQPPEPRPNSPRTTGLHVPIHGQDHAPKPPRVSNIRGSRLHSGPRRGIYLPRLCFCRLHWRVPGIPLLSGSRGRCSGLLLVFRGCTLVPRSTWSFYYIYSWTGFLFGTYLVWQPVAFLRGPHRDGFSGRALCLPSIPIRIGTGDCLHSVSINLPPRNTSMRKNSRSQADISDTDIVSILSLFGVHPSPDQLWKIGEYIRLLLQWNRVISLTSVCQPEEILTRHFGESMFASRAAPVEKGRLADVGSGAGFPGLALKIICPGLSLVLIEPNKKKCAFLWEIARALSLSDVNVIPKTFDEVKLSASTFDHVAVRALGGLPRVLRWSGEVLAPRGQVIFWLGGTDAVKISRTEGWNWETPVRIPESRRRFLLIGRQAGNHAPPTPQRDM
jgi:16S rRNA (guanine527-N7)-methyltransferase